MLNLGISLGIKKPNTKTTTQELPHEDRNVENDRMEVFRNGENPAETKTLIERISLALPSNHQAIKPEYRQTLEKVSFLVANGSRDTHIEEYCKLISALPLYTKVTIFQVQENQQIFANKLPKEVFDRLSFVSVSDTETPWIQDFAKCDSEQNRCISPITIGNERNDDLKAHASAAVTAGVAFDKSPAVFQGGNLVIAQDWSGKRFAFSGSDDFRGTQIVYSEAKVNPSISEAEYGELIKKSFSVDKNIILGIKRTDGVYSAQPAELFHLDQAVLPLSNGVVALVKLVEPPEKSSAVEYNRYLLGQRHLEEYKKTLLENGFNVAEIECPFESYARLQSPVNGLIFRNKDTNERTFLMPIYPDKDGIISLENKSLQKNIAIIEQQGIRVTLVPENEFFKIDGNLHCITNFGGKIVN